VRLDDGRCGRELVWYPDLGGVLLGGTWEAPETWFDGVLLQKGTRERIEEDGTSQK
jgi:hypothetical protein